MQVLIGLVISACLFASFHDMRIIPKDEITIDIGGQYPGQITGIQSMGVQASVPTQQTITPLSALLEKNIIKQTHDFSCGSAALCTLLNFYLNENFTEPQIIEGLMKHGDKRKIMDRRAFSLLDMKKFVQLLGYNGAGYKADLNDLIELDKPCIIPIEFLGYRHFTVLKGVYDNHIFLADPFRGNTSYKLSTFEKMWYENVIFMIDPEGAPTINALQLSNDDLRYIAENTLQDILIQNIPEITFSNKHERMFLFPMPDEYKKYTPR